MPIKPGTPTGTALIPPPPSSHGRPTTFHGAPDPAGFPAHPSVDPAGRVGESVRDRHPDRAPTLPRSRWPLPATGNPPRPASPPRSTPRRGLPLPPINVMTCGRGATVERHCLLTPPPRPAAASGQADWRPRRAPPLSLREKNVEHHRRLQRPPHVLGYTCRAPRQAGRPRRPPPDSREPRRMAGVVGSTFASRGRGQPSIVGPRAAAGPPELLPPLVALSSAAAALAVGDTVTPCCPPARPMASAAARATARAKQLRRR